MDRVVLQSKENNCCDTQSPLKNNNSVGLIEEEKRDTSKENFNPKSLSEIAADTTSKLPPKIEVSNGPSTPKHSKKGPVKKLDSSDYDLDCTLDIQPNYPRQQLEADNPSFSLSFLTNGLNNLGLESSGDHDSRSNATFSDDEEMFVECRSNVSDLSSRSAVVGESANTTVNIETDLKNVEVANETFDAGEANLNETEILSSDKNATFDCNEVLQDGNKTQSLSAGLENETDEFDKTPTNIDVQEPVTIVKAVQSPDVTTPKLNESRTKEHEVVEATMPVERVQEAPAAEVETLKPEKSQPPTLPAKTEEPQALPVPKEEPQSVEAHAQPEVPAVQNDEHKLVYRNIDEVPSHEPMDYESFSEDPLNHMQTSTSHSHVEPAEETLEKFNSPAEKVPEKFNSPTVQKLSENVFVDKMENRFEVEFKMPSAPVFKQPNDGYSNEEFKACASSYSFGESDLDYLQGVGSSKQRQSLFERDSLLLKFDPLLNKPVQVLPATREEDDYVADFELKIPETPQEPSPNSSAVEPNQSVNEQSSQQLSQINNEMSLSVDIMKDISIENKTSELNEEVKLSSHHNEENGNNLKMAEVKKEADVREESLLKRISEKDKQIAKMNGVVEAYEKAISELIAEKEQMVLTYEKKLQDLRHESEQNAHHLASLEATFSDLHAKYERTKHVAIDYKDREDSLLQDNKTLTESLKMQEVRYDKMKSHAMAQLEIANTSLADMNRNNHAEQTKLRAQLKKEEISRDSLNEQLIQKTKENSELVKICDELINGTQSS